jgi:uncharacterized protein (TIGR03435 family)
MLSAPKLAGRPVLNRTGLTDDYFIDIQYGPDEDLVSTVEDQGLKLEPAKEPIQILVIDRVERPSEN